MGLSYRRSIQHERGCVKKKFGEENRDEEDEEDQEKRIQRV
jgi:hypothetical protein